MAKIILAISMLSAVVVSNAACADGYQPGGYVNTADGGTATEFEDR